MAKWEYRTLVFDLRKVRGLDHTPDELADMEQQLSSLGIEGWEVVSTDTLVADTGTRALFLILRRELREERDRKLRTI